MKHGLILWKQACSPWFTRELHESGYVYDGMELLPFFRHGAGNPPQLVDGFLGGPR